MNEMAKSGRFYLVDSCRLCGSSELGMVIPLAPLPVRSPNVGLGSSEAELAPADVHQCAACGFLQLRTVINPEFQYRNFKYETGISVGLREHFADMIAGLAETGEIGPGKFVFDIGSNDGSLLAIAKDRGARVLGIDPAEKIALAATQKGIPTIGDFFTTETAKQIAAKHGKADVVISNNTIANIDDLDSLFEGIIEVMAPNGLLVIETQYAIDMLNNTLLDVIYHEHISYFAVAPMERYLKRHGLALIGAERIAPKGGSVRFYIQLQNGLRPVSASVGEMIESEKIGGLFEKSTFDAFNARVSELGSRIRTRLEKTKVQNGRALAFGSSVGCAALIQYFNLSEILDATFDDTPLADFVSTSSKPIPVLNGTKILDEPATEIVVLAWRYMPNIAKRYEAFQSKGGKFYRALPDLAYASE